MWESSPPHHFSLIFNKDEKKQNSRRQKTSQKIPYTSMEKRIFLAKTTHSFLVKKEKLTILPILK